MKKDIAKFVAKCPNCQQVKVEHQWLGGLAQNIEHQECKWEMINMDFITRLPISYRQHDSFWLLSKNDKVNPFHAGKDNLLSN